MAQSGGLLNPPTWGASSFELWIKQVKAWKVATTSVPGLKDVHAIQLALHLPEHSDIRNDVFEAFDVDTELAGDAGWKTLIEFLEENKGKDDSSTHFDTWKDFKNLQRCSDQTIDQFIQAYALTNNRHASG